MSEPTFHLVAALMPEGWTVPRYSHQLPDFTDQSIQVVVAGPYDSYEDVETDAFMYLDDGCIVYVMKDGEAVSDFAPHEA